MAKRTFDPEAVLAALARGEMHCGEGAMRIDSRGVWYHEDAPIRRIELVKLFRTALRRAPDGRHWLLTPFERIPVEVEDAPFLAVELAAGGEGRSQRLHFRTNLDEWLLLGADASWRLRRRGEALVPYLVLEDGLEARVTRPVYYELAAKAVPGPEQRGAPLGVWSAGRFFPLEDGGA